MVTPTSDCKQLVPMRESMVMLNQMPHRSSSAADAQPPGTAAHNGVDGDMHLYGTVMHQATPAECYGCVDWFNF